MATPLQKREAAYSRFKVTRMRAWAKYQTISAACERKTKAAYARVVREEMRETKRYARACQAYDAAVAIQKEKL